jgi:hypothetical protein
MFKTTTFVSGLLLSGFVISGLLGTAPLSAQSALAQRAGQSTTQQTAKSPTANSAKPPAKKPTAKKAPAKPLVYVEDNRNPAKSADAKTEVSASTKSVNATPGKPGDASVKKASASATATRTGSAGTTKTATPQTQLSADVTKAFSQNCPSVELTASKSKAAYDVTLDREPGSKGVKSAFGLRKTSRIDVTSKSGKALFSETGHSTGQLVKDACTTMGTPTTRIAKN